MIFNDVKRHHHHHNPIKKIFNQNGSFSTPEVQCINIMMRSMIMFCWVPLDLQATGSQLTCLVVSITGETFKPIPGATLLSIRWPIPTKQLQLLCNCTTSYEIIGAKNIQTSSLPQSVLCSCWWLQLLISSHFPLQCTQQTILSTLIWRQKPCATFKSFSCECNE